MWVHVRIPGQPEIIRTRSEAVTVRHRGELHILVRLLKNLNAGKGKPIQCSLAKLVAKHGKAALGGRTRSLVLDHIPVLDQNAVLDPENVCGNPIHRSTETAKSPVHHHEVSLGHDRSGFVLQRWWDALDKIEKTLTARCDMSAVLNVVRGPVALGRYVVSLLKRVSKASRTSALFFSCLVGFIEFFLPGKTMPFALSRLDPPSTGKLAPVIQPHHRTPKNHFRPPRRRACRFASRPAFQARVRARPQSWCNDPVRRSFFTLEVALLSHRPGRDRTQHAT